MQTNPPLVHLTWQWESSMRKKNNPQNGKLLSKNIYKSIDRTPNPTFTIRQSTSMGQISPVGCPNGDCITCVDHGIMVKTNEMNTVQGSMVNLITNIGELMDFQRWHKIHELN